MWKPKYWNESCDKESLILGITFYNGRYLAYNICGQTYVKMVNRYQNTLP